MDLFSGRRMTTAKQHLQQSQTLDTINDTTTTDPVYIGRAQWAPGRRYLRGLVQLSLIIQRQIVHALVDSAAPEIKLVAPHACT